MTERPDDTRGPGLFAYLRSLRGDNGQRERRDVIATVFQGFANRMESGYLLRDVVNLIDGIHFDSSEEVHTLGRLYGRCFARCATPQGSLANSTRPDRLCGSWSR